MRAPASRRGTTSIRALGYVTSSVDNLGRETFKQFDGLEGVPPADLHDDPWIHLAINEKPLGEASPEIVR